MLRDRLRSQNAPLVVHLAVLGVGLLVYAIVATREWFFYDDWYYLTQQQDLIWSPHVGHWSTIPALIFLGLQRAFGMDDYLPFAIPAILAHLGVVHLLWRIMLRSRVRPWIATAISLLLVFLGAGAEAIDWAVQIGFVGAITGMLGVILLLDTPCSASDAGRSSRCSSCSAWQARKSRSRSSWWRSPSPGFGTASPAPLGSSSVRLSAC